MSIHEIEKLSFAELKAQREPLTESLKSESAEVLATRYFKAFMNAKQRDELLGKQGKTLTALEDGLEAVKGQASAAALKLREVEGERDALAKELGDLRLIAEEQVQGLAAEKAELHKQLRAERERSARLKAEAIRNHQAVSQAAKLLNDALTAQAVEAADAGE